MQNYYKNLQPLNYLSSDNHTLISRHKTSYPKFTCLIINVSTCIHSIFKTFKFTYLISIPNILREYFSTCSWLHSCWVTVSQNNCNAFNYDMRMILVKRLRF